MAFHASPPADPEGADAAEGEKDLDSLLKAVRPLIPSNVKSVSNQKELDAFLASTVQMPKVLFFSDKLTKPSLLVKALSNAFKDKLACVLLNSAAFPEAVKKYKVSSFPHLVVVRKDKKDEVYKGAFEFHQLFDWLNVFSETFVMGGGFSDTPAAAEFDLELQPWKVEAVPELTKQSSQDVCFKKSNKFVCVVLAKKGRKLTEEEQEMMESLKADYEAHQGKGPDFRFMWIDLETESEWAQLFELKKAPSVVAINPHKKVRFLKLDADLPGRGVFQPGALLAPSNDEELAAICPVSMHVTVLRCETLRITGCSMPKTAEAPSLASLYKVDWACFRTHKGLSLAQ
ncbi:putative thioredoxin [Cyclospora cayetanensis]|uniref:Thioredoxin n=1 Tax=Cyclospora cayetanensis TaxID=88456 RepID=A0A1D3CX02_9EIME|nr:putative thioredoxin [Cyclospora cayetanensis]